MKVDTSMFVADRKEGIAEPRGSELRVCISKFAGLQVLLVKSSL